ncbi:hypothetical protein [Brevibacillus sp. HB2.2]|uniref:hypothetical protein n=1 Tax=Brevibacillus sp. HB2.2 TaxID=2738846 RepID=UPI00156B3879|nr:hypothetical protein [Brevibacillus sp. HB2.2]NRS50962.1 hypothetical protein [Brevibacillus sp. HB2.2]
MAQIVTITSDFNEVIFGATGETEVIQNVRTIMRSMIHTCPMYRLFGWDPNIDAPVNAYMAITSARLIEKIQQYEPRAEVQEVTYEGDENGMLKPSVKVAIKGV